MRAKFGVPEQTCGLRLHAKFCLKSVYFVALWRRKTPNFTILLTLAFCDVASWRQSEKVAHRCTTTNLPLSNGIKIVSVLQRFHGEIMRTNSDVQKRDGQTDTQTDRQTHRQKTQRFCRPGGRWNPSTAKIGMVIEDLEHILTPPVLYNFWGVRRIVSPLAGAENSWEFRPLNLKHPLLRNRLSKSIQILTANASWNEVQTLQILWKSRNRYASARHLYSEIW